MNVYEPGPFESGPCRVCGCEHPRNSISSLSGNEYFPYKEDNPFWPRGDERSYAFIDSLSIDQVYFLAVYGQRDPEHVLARIKREDPEWMRLFMGGLAWMELGTIILRVLVYKPEQPDFVDMHEKWLWHNKNSISPKYRWPRTNSLGAYIDWF